MERLTDMPNVGAVLAQRLDSAGVHTPADLRTLGSIEALRLVRSKVGPDVPCANMLYALEGAVRGIRWHDIPKRERDDLWREYLTCLDK